MHLASIRMSAFLSKLLYSISMSDLQLIKATDGGAGDSVFEPDP